MLLFKDNNSEWYVRSDTERMYKLVTTMGLQNHCHMDIVVIFAEINEYVLDIVNFFWGADDFVNNPNEDTLSYIRTVIDNYEKIKYTDKKEVTTLIKEF